MLLEKITILNFKNIRECSLSLSPGLNCFVGENGAGKTNIVDAIYYMSMCKSSLGMTDMQNARHGEDFFVLDGEYRTDSGKGEDVVCGFKRGAGKTFRRSGKEYERLADHIGLVPIVIVSPADSALINDSADERRRYLNGFISQLDREYLNAIVRYNHILGERNRLLKQSNNQTTSELLDILDMQMCESGAVVYSKRRELIARLAPLVADFYSTLSDDREVVELTYRSQLNDDSFADLLRESRHRDMINQFSSVGPHRDDMVMKIGGYPLRKYGSQGQQKSFLIALKLGQFKIVEQERNEKPLLLLDDLFDKLDTQRVAKLLSVVNDRFGQIFITDCNKERLESVLRQSNQEYNMWNVIDGEVTA